MREKEKKELLFFILRTSMYTGRVTKDNIVCFIYGYELGAKTDCLFIKLLSQKLEEKYGYKCGALKWVRQIEEFAIKRKMSWVSAFKRISVELINESNTESFQQQIDEHIRKSIIHRAERFKRGFYVSNIDDWIGICNLKEDWFKKLWTNKERTLLNKFDKEIRLIARNNFVKEEFEFEKIKPFPDKVVAVAEKVVNEFDKHIAK